ncbi:hypothetical protein [Shinella granuli]|uniref:Uncharacterized protein n=1 Tax=Shinella granuli TaxID=323621 RepID=A0A4R2D532_SHIGR|nr:hypothetical protein [Shinella granuli]TCN48072.1 hypothetical protein EV665_102601 [Shinella granuli]
MIKEILYEPGFWAISGLLACGIVNLASALATRWKYAELREIARSLMEDARATKQDRAWMRAYLREAQGSDLWVIAACAPILPLLAAVFTLQDALKKNPSKKESMREFRAHTADMERRMLSLSTGHDMKEAALWDDPRRRRMADLSSTAEFRSHPFLAAWIIAWGLPSLLLLFIIGSFMSVAGYSVRRLVALYRVQLQWKQAAIFSRGIHTV